MAAPKWVATLLLLPAILAGTDRGAERPVRVIWRIAAKPLE
jgi:hypothetical protein